MKQKAKKEKKSHKNQRLQRRPIKGNMHNIEENREKEKLLNKQNRIFLCVSYSLAGSKRVFPLFGAAVVTNTLGIKSKGNTQHSSSNQQKNEEKNKENFLFVSAAKPAKVSSSSSSKNKA